MSGFDLQNGDYITETLSNEEIWDAFDWLFSGASKNDASYKFIFFKAITDCLKHSNNGYLTFDTVFRRFTQISWNLILKYNIIQKRRQSDGRITLLEQCVLQYGYDADEVVDFDALSLSIQNKITREIKNNCKKYVVGALYADMKGYFYSFNKREEWIRVNPQMISFIVDNRYILEGLNYYKWAQFYEKVNDDSVKNELYKTFGCVEGESVFYRILKYEFTYGDIGEEEEVNTLELLFEAEKSEKRAEDLSMFTNYEVETELYKDIEHFKQYVDDPICLLKQLKIEKGIIV